MNQTVERAPGVPNLLIVDDEPQVAAALKRLFHAEHYAVRCAGGGREAVRLLETCAADVILCDEHMPGLRGSDVLRVVKERWPDTMRIMITGNADLDAALRAINEGEAYRFITKPWHDAELLITVRQALERGNLQRELRRLAAEVEQQRNVILSLEGQYPGITSLRIDAQGYYIATPE